MATIARRAGKRFCRTTARANAADKDGCGPVTDADRVSHQIIVDGLRALDEGWPIVSEESAAAAYDVRRTWSRFWLVDPLDGTKEFLNRNPEFTVNIALVEPVARRRLRPVDRLLIWPHPTRLASGGGRAPQRLRFVPEPAAPCASSRADPSLIALSRSATIDVSERVQVGVACFAGSPGRADLSIGLADHGMGRRRRRLYLRCSAPTPNVSAATNSRDPHSAADGAEGLDSNLEAHA